MNQFNRSQLTQTQSFRTVEVDVTEWGDIDPETNTPQKTSLFVREISVRDRERFEDSLWQGKGQNREIRMLGGRVKLIILSACDAEGNRIFENSDAELLSTKSSRVIDRIYEAATKLNSITEQDEEDLVKN